MRQKHFYIVLALIPIFIGIIGLLALLQSPYTGLHFKFENDKWYISSIDKDSPAARYTELKGKEITSIDGYALTKADLIFDPILINKFDDYRYYWKTQHYLCEHIKLNTSFTITYKDQGKNFNIHFVPTTLPLKTHIFPYAITIFLNFVILLSGLLVVMKKSDDLKAIMLFYMVFVISLHFIFKAGYVFRDLGYYNESLFFLFVLMRDYTALYMGIQIFHLSLIFPESLKLARNRFFLIFLYTLPNIVMILYQLRVTGDTVEFFNLILGGITLFILFRRYLTIQSSSQKTQTGLVIMGFAVSLLLFLVFYLVPFLFFGYITSVLLLTIFVFPAVLALTVAIMRYKLMDIDSLFDNTLIYSVTIGLLALIDMAVVYILTSNKIPLLVFKEPFPTIIAVWVIIFTYVPVRNRVRDIIKRLLKREIYDLNEVSLSFGKSLLAIQSVHEISEATKQVIGRTLHPRGIRIELFLTPQSVQMTVNADDGGALISLPSSRGALGVIRLQRKHSDRLYDRNDIKLLDTISNQAALAIESILYREEIKRKEEENRQEKERISKEIHDGIGSSLVQAKLLLNMANKDTNAINEASTVIDNGIKEMRELIWVVEQDEQTLGDLIYHIEGRLEQAKNILNINVITKIEDESIILTPEQKLNISRIVQESITNIIKHAQASRADILFSQHDKDVEIIIRDNGKGFDTSKTGNESYGLRNMRARAEKIGAQLNISSETGKGSEVKLNILL